MYPALACNRQLSGWYGRRLRWRCCCRRERLVRGTVVPRYNWGEGLPDRRRGKSWDQCLLGVLQPAEASPSPGIPGGSVPG